MTKMGIGTAKQYDGFAFTSLCRGGRLHIDHELFRGTRFSLAVPRHGAMPDRIDGGKVNVMTYDADYEVLLANCDQLGRKVEIVGDVVFDLATYASNGSGTGYSNSDAFSVWLSYFLVFSSVFLCLFCSFLRCRISIREVATLATEATLPQPSSSSRVVGSRSRSSEYSAVSTTNGTMA